MDIFVGSLPFKIKEKELQNLFEQYGTVSSVKIIIDKISRQNKGFGFVEMLDEEEALAAIKSLNGKEVMGRSIVVNKSEEKKETNKRRGPIFKSQINRKEEDATNVPWKKKLHPKKKIITYGEESGEKKKVKLARKHKQPWKKK
jgi:RNA recognition motif-containing protein